ncbi:MAG: hypothetical protein ACR2FY_12610 [Pirellulaceae bacterium]
MNRMKWLMCNVSRGQFSDEFAVRGADYEGEEFSLFVRPKFLALTQPPSADDEVSGFLCVIELERRDGLCLIRLPGQTFENGSTITVRDEQLEASPSHQCA